jgi:hypothetical protein
VFIGIKYGTGTIKGAATPSPTTVVYTFATTGVPNSTSQITLSMKASSAAKTAAAKNT